MIGSKAYRVQNLMSHNNLIRVLLIDDNPYFLEAVTTVLNTVEDIQLIGRGSNGKEALQLCEQLKPDLILLDVVMPVMTGVEATRQIHHSYPEMKILVLSSFHDDESVREMLLSGAAGYILKGSLASDLVSTIRAVHSGKAVFSSEVAYVLLQKPKDEARPDFGFTRRELGVLRLMAEGLSHKQIAARLTISQSTVKYHIVNVLKKMAVETRAEAIALAAKYKLI
jgi:NarL family two-component system response regulator LiaR